ncbi:exosortase V [Sphingomonas bacterium]|uniref:exosortase V n=1 Tax=Sphingomonas bacterium TaxID=1895847 RepID=UPI00157762C6|nr:exosortase V [Sphingomonas bacterium]
MTYQTTVTAEPAKGSARDWRALGFVFPVAIGMAVLIVPTLRGIADVSWSTEQGAHGPIVLAIAIWLFARRWPAIRAAAEPGSALIGGIVLAMTLLSYIATRVVGSIVLESLSLYGALVATLYLMVGWRGMRQAWFAIAYFLFVLPPPGSLVAIATQPLRLQLSAFAVIILAKFGLPVAQEGLLIYIGQYTLEVKAACSGLNSIISLSAIGLFYAYIRHKDNVMYMVVLAGVIVAMAILANLCRVMLLVLITYFLGNDAAQGFLHQFAGITMFVVALAGTMAFDVLAERYWPTLVNGRSGVQA